MGRQPSTMAKQPTRATETIVSTRWAIIRTTVLR